MSEHAECTLRFKEIETALKSTQTTLEKSREEMLEESEFLMSPLSLNLSELSEIASESRKSQVAVLHAENKLTSENAREASELLRICQTE